MAMFKFMATELPMFRGFWGLFDGSYGCLQHVYSKIIISDLDMVDVAEFKKLIKENLESKGVIQQIQANLRSEVFKSLHEPRPIPPNAADALCEENLVVNELIREYLEYNKHHNSLSVFNLETGTPRQGVDREFVKSDLNLEESGHNVKKLPLMYGIVAMLQSVEQHKQLLDHVFGI